MAFRLKFDRALQYLDSLEAPMDDWVQRGGYTLSDYVDVNTGQQVVQIHYARRPPTDDWGLALGDCVQNLRNSLDLLAFELAESYTGRPLPDRIAKKSEFPIFGERLPTTSEMQDKIGGIDPRACTIIESLQPYRMEAGYERHPVWMLHRLANIDKHRALHRTPFLTYGIEISGRNYELTETFYQSGELQDGAELVRFKVKPQEEMDMQFRFPVFIAFPQGPPGFGLPVIPALRNIGGYVEKAVFEPLAIYL